MRNIERINENVTQHEKNIAKYIEELNNFDDLDASLKSYRNTDENEKNVKNPDAEMLRSDDADKYDILNMSNDSEKNQEYSHIMEKSFEDLFRSNILEENIPLSLSDSEPSNEFNSTWASEMLLSDRELSNDSLSDDIKLSQLDGNSDFSGLAGITCKSSVLFSIINIFRSLENIWETFEDHKLCLVPHAENDRRCMFCHVRSIALRVNRAKIRVKLKPFEILS